MLLRHGETDFNAKKLFPGSLDVKLNSNGLNQARSVQLPLTPDKVIASDLSRAIRTAQEIVSTHGLSKEVEIDARLREKHGGIVEGLLIRQIQETYPDIWNAWDLQNLLEIATKSRYPGGESDIDVMARLKSLLEEIESNLVSKIVLLVTHGGVMRAMRLLVNLRRDTVYPGKHIKNCSIEIYKPVNDRGIDYEYVT